MFTSTSLEDVLNQLLRDNQTYKFLLLSLLRDKSTADLNRHILEVRLRTELATQANTSDDFTISTNASAEMAIKMISNIIAEKSASI